MSEALLDVYRSLTSAMSQSLRSGLASSGNGAATLADDVQRTLEAPSYRDCLNRLIALIRGGALAEQPNELRDIAEKLFTSRLGALNELLRIVKESEARGKPVTGADQLRDEVRRVERQRDAMLEHWPILEQGDAEAARAEDNLEECLNLEEAFAGLLNVDVDELRRRAAQQRQATRR